MFTFSTNYFNQRMQAMVLINLFLRSTKDTHTHPFWYSRLENRSVQLFGVTESWSFVELLSCTPFEIEGQSYILPLGGVLKDQQKYFEFRGLFFCDDFKLASPFFHKLSVGECYIIPLGLLLFRRKQLSSTRAISLTSPGVSTN